MAKEKLEVVVARIDENVKLIKDELEDHENRIRDNEKFKQRGYGALGLIAAAVTVIGGVVVKLMIG